MTIFQELAFAENATAAYYSGSEVLNIAPSDVISASQWSIKQAACAVTVTGLEMLQNSSDEQIIDLVAARVKVGENTMKNLIATGIYSDGTGTNGKQITGVAAMLGATPTSGVVGGIDRASWSFWQNQTLDYNSDIGASATASNINTGFNLMYAKCSRGSDVPNLILLDNFLWSLYMANNQNNQRFVGNSKLANMGFVTAKYMNADVVLDGGIGGNVPSHIGYWLNTDYMFYRPHRMRNFSAIGDERMSTNQDASVRLMGWAGNMTASGLKFQGYMHA